MAGARVGNDKLSAQQLQFIDDFLVDFNATSAALKAGYSESSAEAQGSRLLKNAKVMAEINARQSEYHRKNKIKKEDVIKMLTQIAGANIKDYVKFNGRSVRFKSFDELTQDQLMAIESIKQGKNGVELKLHGKSWSIDMLNKHLGNYEIDNGQKGAAAPRVIISLPDNRRGKIVPINQEEPPKSDD